MVFVQVLVVVQFLVLVHVHVLVLVLVLVQVLVLILSQVLNMTGNDLRELEGEAFSSVGLVNLQRLSLARSPLLLTNILVFKHVP